MGGVAWGAEGRVWLSPRLGIQLEGTVAASRFGGGAFTPGGFVTTPKDAQVVTVTGQVVYRPVRAGYPLWLSAGVGVVRYGGEAYAVTGVGTPTTPAAALGLGSDVHIGRRLTATVGVVTLLYSLHVTDDLGQSYQQGFQTDILAHVGLAWCFD